MTRRTKRLWTDEEKRSICLQTTAPGVSVAQVARRYAMNANRCPAVVCLQTMRGMIFKWLRDPRYTLEAGSGAPAIAPDAGSFRPVEIVDRPRHDGAPAAIDPAPAAGAIEIDVAGGHRLRISGAYDPEALARLILGLSA